ncbi:MAG TPA: zinc-binding dehydrogenase [Solirubrobacteraceae bacterium]|jgi:D-arabinose 1-dehydrogenase-like Zn-dependent alcohol dehydrogenase
MTSGSSPPLDLERVFLARLRIFGTTLGTSDELAALAALCAERALRPPVDEMLPLAEARKGFQRMLDGDLLGKLVVRP